MELTRSHAAVTEKLRLVCTARVRTERQMLAPNPAAPRRGEAVRLAHILLCGQARSVQSRFVLFIVIEYQQQAGNLKIILQSCKLRGRKAPQRMGSTYTMCRYIRHHLHGVYFKAT